MNTPIHPRAALRRCLPYLLTSLLTVYGAVVLNVRGSANGVLFTFAIIGLATSTRILCFAKDDHRLLSLIAWAGLLPVLVALANEAIRSIWLPRNVDLPLRFALLGPCIAGALTLHPRHFKHLQWGFIVGACISCARLIYENRCGVRVAQIGFLNTIPFSNITLLFGLLALLSTGWTITGRRAEHWLKIVACIAGIVGALVSGSRGGWLALPITMPIIWRALRHRRGTLAQTYTEKMFIAAMALLLLVAGLALGWHRITDAVSDIRNILYDDRATSIGLRLEMWQAAIMMLRSHFLLGVGADQFCNTLIAYVNHGLVLPAAAVLRHSHNDMLHALATNGVLGALALLAQYSLPLAYFLRALRAPTQTTRCAAAMGATIVLGYVVFGLTETMFIISMNTAIYVLLIGVMLAFVTVSRSARHALTA